MGGVLFCRICCNRWVDGIDGRRKIHKRGAREAWNGVRMVLVKWWCLMRDFGWVDVPEEKCWTLSVLIEALVEVEVDSMQRERRGHSARERLARLPSKSAAQVVSRTFVSLKDF